MKTIQFKQTKLDLSEFGLKISADFNSLILEISKKNNVSCKMENNILERFEHIYLVNQYLLKKIEKLETFLHEGFLSQDREYFESDFTIIKTMLKISLFKIRSSQDFSIPLYFSIEDLELKLAVQLQKLIRFSIKVPAVFASNYQTEIKVISGIKLDIYQLIFFAMKHTHHYLNQIQTLNRSQNIIN